MRTRSTLLTFVALALTTACSSAGTDAPSAGEDAQPSAGPSGADGANQAARGTNARAALRTLTDARQRIPAAWTPDGVTPSLPGADCPSAPLGLGPFAAFAAGTGGGVVAGLTESGDVVLATPNATGGHTQRLISELHGALSIAAGDEHVCAVMPDGTVGCAGSGRVWLGSNANKDTVFRVRSIDLSSRTTSPVVQVVAGGGASCALTADRHVICWGADKFTAGPGLTRSEGSDDDDAKGPPLFELTNPFWSPVKSLATSGGHVCALLDDGNVTCFGNDSLGQLGNANPSFLVGPGRSLTANPGHSNAMPLTQVPLAAPADVIAVGTLNGCALETGGAVECWGDDGGGQLGDLGAQLQSLKPMRLPLASLALSGVVEDIAFADGFACARSNEGELACWGRDASGAIAAPALVDLKGHSAHAVRISGARACALLENKNVCCF